MITTDSDVNKQELLKELNRELYEGSVYRGPDGGWPKVDAATLHPPSRRAKAKPNEERRKDLDVGYQKARKKRRLIGRIRHQITWKPSVLDLAIARWLEKKGDKYSIGTSVRELVGPVSAVKPEPAPPRNYSPLPPKPVPEPPPPPPPPLPPAKRLAADMEDEEDRIALEWLKKRGHA